MTEHILSLLHAGHHHHPHGDVGLLLACGLTLGSLALLAGVAKAMGYRR